MRPAIAEAMDVAPADLAMDVDVKYQPEPYTEIVRAPEPDRVVGDAPSPQLFDLDADPGEEHDLAAAEPARVARMEADLDRWFEAVEADRLTTSG